MRSWTLICLILLALATHGCTQPPQKPQLPEPPPKPVATVPTPPTEEELNRQIKHLLKELLSEDYRQREQASVQLAVMIAENPKSIELIEAIVKKPIDPEIAHRFEITVIPIIEWGITGAVLRAFPHIIAKLESSNKDVRKRLASELGDRKPEGAAKLLIRLIKLEEDESVRIAATEALSRLGTPAVKPLARALASKNECVRACAAEALGSIGDKQVVNRLKELWKKDRNYSVRLSAAFALAMIEQEKGALEFIIEFLAEEEGIIVFPDPGTENLDQIATRLLIKVGKRAVSYLIEALRDDNYGVRARAAEILGVIGDRTAVEPLGKLVEDDKQLVRCDAVEALGKLGDDRASGVLIKALEDEDQVVRQYAAEALVKVNGEQTPFLLADALEHGLVLPEITRAFEGLADTHVVPRLISVLLKNKESRVRERTAEILGALGDKRAISPLNDVLRHNSSMAVQDEAARALRRLCDAVFMQQLLQTLQQGKDYRKREEAASILGVLSNSRAVKPLIGVLQSDPNPNLRLAAARSLGELGDAQATDALVKAANSDTNPAVRDTAAVAICFLHDKRAILYAKKFLKSGDNSLAIEVCRALEGMDDCQWKEALPELDTILDRGPSETTKAAARVLLTHDFDWKKHYKHNPDRLRNIYCCVLVHGKTSTERSQAAKTLGNLADVSTIGDLICALRNDEDEWVRGSAASALIEIGDTQAAEPLIKAIEEGKVFFWIFHKQSIFDSRHVPHLLSILESSKKEDIRNCAIYLLGEIGDTRAIEPLLAVMREDPNPEMRRQAISALGDIGDTRGIEPLVTMLKSDPNAENRKSAACALWSMKNPAALRPLINALKNEKDSEVRYWAAAALDETDDPRAIEAAIAALKDDPDENVREEALRAVCKHKGKEAVSLLIDVLKNDTYFQVRGNAAAALGELGVENAKSALIRALKNDKEPFVRTRTVKALSRFKGEEIVKALKAAAKDPHELVRAEALLHLTKIEAETPAEFIVEALKREEKPFARCYAVSALGRLKTDLALRIVLDTSTNDSHERVRAAALEALGRWDKPEVREALLKALRSDKSEYARKYAALSLRHFADNKEVARALEKAFNEDNHGAAIALAYAKGKRYAKLIRIIQIPSSFRSGLFIKLGQYVFSPPPMGMDYHQNRLLALWGKVELLRFVGCFKELHERLPQECPRVDLKANPEKQRAQIEKYNDWIERKMDRLVWDGESCQYHLKPEKENNK